MMISPHSYPAPRRPAGGPGHAFEVGQLIRLKSRSRLALNEIYRITSKLPLRDTIPQYRVRSDKESYERVVMEDSMELVPPAAEGEGTSLLTRTFGHG